MICFVFCITISVTWNIVRIKVYLRLFTIRGLHDKKKYIKMGNIPIVYKILCCNIFFAIKLEFEHAKWRKVNIEKKKCKIFLTPTWFEHAAFWSGVRRATVAPRSHNDKRVKKIGSTEIWTRIAGFKVQSANHYTIEPRLVYWIHFLGQDISCSVFCHALLW